MKSSRKLHNKFCRRAIILAKATLPTLDIHKTFPSRYGEKNMEINYFAMFQMFLEITPAK